MGRVRDTLKHAAKPLLPRVKSRSSEVTRSESSKCKFGLVWACVVRLFFSDFRKERESDLEILFNSLNRIKNENSKSASDSHRKNA